RWTSRPDTLERLRQKDPKAVRLKFEAVERPETVGGGDARLLPIDGIASEVALVAYVSGDRFLWASDFIQTLDEPTLYASAVIAAVQRAGIQPERIAAEHVPLSEWKDVVAAQKTGRRSGS